MDPAKNPFSPGAGVQPPELAGRKDILEKANLAIRRMNYGNFSRSCLLLGLRGVGKTVLLTRIESMAKEQNCEVCSFEVSQNTSLPQQLANEAKNLLQKFSKKEKMKETVKTAASVLRGFASAFSLKLGDFSIEVLPTPASGDLRVDMIALLLSIGLASKEVNRTTVLLIDELHTAKKEELGSLIMALHKISQLNLPILLFGAGLPLLTKLAAEARTYAERLFEYPIVGSLNDGDAKKALIAPVEKYGVSFEKKAIELILKKTLGYPYFLQVWGSHSWNQAISSIITENDVQIASKNALAELDNDFYRIRYEKLSPRQKDYVHAMATLKDRNAKSAEIAQAMRLKVNQAAPFRRDLIKSGTIYSPDRGLSAFTVPGFGDYLNRIKQSGRL